MNQHSTCSAKRESCMRRQRENARCISEINELVELVRVRFCECRVGLQSNVESRAGRIDGSNLPSHARIIQNSRVEIIRQSRRKTPCCQHPIDARNPSLYLASNWSQAADPIPDSLDHLRWMHRVADRKQSCTLGFAGVGGQGRREYPERRGLANLLARRFADESDEHHVTAELPIDACHIASFASGLRQKRTAALDSCRLEIPDL